MNQLLNDWENFLIDIDKQLDQIVGPKKVSDLNYNNGINFKL